MTGVWYAVCDQTRARFFTAKPFHLVEQIENELGRTRNREMEWDKPGFSRAKLVGPASLHALTGEKDPHEQASQAFAAEIADYLDRRLLEKEFEQVVVVAGPRMCGRIRRAMTKRLTHNAVWIQKDLTHVEDHHLPGSLGLPQSILDGYARMDTRPPGA